MVLLKLRSTLILRNYGHAHMNNSRLRNIHNTDDTTRRNNNTSADLNANTNTNALVLLTLILHMHSHENNTDTGNTDDSTTGKM